MIYRSSKLLTVIFQLLVTPSAHFPLLLEIFAQTFKPFIFMIEKFVNFGEISDPFEEFFVVW